MAKALADEGTSRPATTASGDEAPPSSETAHAGNPRAAIQHAEDQSFADPVHRGGSPSVAPEAQPSAGLASHGEEE
jgi:hypothetical protein